MTYGTLCTLTFRVWNRIALHDQWHRCTFYFLPRKSKQPLGGPWLWQKTHGVAICIWSVLVRCTCAIYSSVAKVLSFILNYHGNQTLTVNIRSPEASTTKRALSVHPHCRWPESLLLKDQPAASDKRWCPMILLSHLTLELLLACAGRHIIVHGLNVPS